MARLARVVAVGEPHHLTQRGNNRQAIFFDDHDRQTYCALLSEQARRAGIRILVYCLGTNPAHLAAVTARGVSVAERSNTRSRRSCLFCLCTINTLRSPVPFAPIREA